MSIVSNRLVNLWRNRQRPDRGSVSTLKTQKWVPAVYILCSHSALSIINHVEALTLPPVKFALPLSHSTPASKRRPHRAALARPSTVSLNNDLLVNLLRFGRPSRKAGCPPYADAKTPIPGPIKSRDRSRTAARKGEPNSAKIRSNFGVRVGWRKLTAPGGVADMRIRH